MGGVFALLLLACLLLTVEAHKSNTAAALVASLVSNEADPLSAARAQQIAKIVTGLDESRKGFAGAALGTGFLAMVTCLWARHLLQEELSAGTDRHERV